MYAIRSYYASATGTRSWWPSSAPISATACKAARRIRPPSRPRKIVEWGGEIKRETQIVEVKAGESTLADQNGEKYNYDTLIWASDLKTMYRITDPEGMAPSYNFV